MSRQAYFLRVLFAGAGSALFAALIIACVVSLWLLIATLRRSSSRRALPVTSTAAALVAALAVLRMQGSWRTIIELTSQGRSEYSYQHSMLIAQAVGQLVTTVSCAPLVLLAAMLTVAFALIRGQRQSVTRGAGAMAAVLVALSATFVAHAFEPFRHGFGCARDCQYNSLMHVIAELRRGQLAVSLSAAALCVFSMLWLRRKFRHSATPKLGAVGTALLVLGVSAVFATRQLRWDASHPVPQTAPNAGQCPVSEALEASLPFSSTDCVALEGVQLELLSDAVTLDGIRVTEPAELGELLQQKVELWRQINPGAAFVGTIVVLAPTDATTAALEPWLAAAQHADFSSFAILMRAAPESFPSQTLGALRRQRCCARRVALSDSATAHVTDFATWGDLARGALPAVSLR